MLLLSLFLVGSWSSGVWAQAQTHAVDLQGISHIAPLNISLNQRLDIDLAQYGERLYLKLVSLNGTLMTFAGSWADDIGVYIYSENAVSNPFSIFPAQGQFQSGPGIGVGPYQITFDPGFSLSLDGGLTLVFFDDSYDVAGQPDATWQSGLLEFEILNCFPADWAEPFGTLDFFDVSQFLDLYLQNELSVDLTGDGKLNFFDVSAFLNAYTAGCP